MNWLRKALKLPLNLALKSPSLRKKLVYELRRNHFSEMQFKIPLNAELSCPIFQERFAWSFSEIFLNAEYGNFLKETGLPQRWLDIGCHAGFFSLYLAWQHIEAGNRNFEGLLIDADPRVEADVRKLLETTNLSDRLRFELGAIGAGNDFIEFAMRDGMSSSASSEANGEKIARVPVLPSARIIRPFPPPYDLIKLDVEGAEDVFLEKYGPIYTNSRYLILEWHSPDREGKAALKVKERMEEAEFELTDEIQGLKTHIIEGRVLTTGCHLYRNLRFQNATSARNGGVGKLFANIAKS
jgi:FkbM family methyltransferase